MEIYKLDDFINEGMLNRMAGNGISVEKFIEYMLKNLYETYRKLHFKDDQQYDKNDKEITHSIKYDRSQKSIYFDYVNGYKPFIEFFVSNTKRKKQEFLILDKVPNGGFSTNEFDKLKKRFLSESECGMTYMLLNSLSKGDPFARDYFQDEFIRNNPYIVYYGGYGYLQVKDLPKYYYIKIDLNNSRSRKDWKTYYKYSMFNTAAEELPESKYTTCFYFKSKDLAEACKKDLKISLNIETYEK